MPDIYLTANAYTQGRPILLLVLILIIPLIKMLV